MTKRRFRRSSDAFTLIELTRRHRHHRGIDRACSYPPSSLLVKPRAALVHQQSQADRTGDAQLREFAAGVAADVGITTALLQPPYTTVAWHVDLTNISLVGPDDYEPPCPIQIPEVCNNTIDVQTWVTICLPYFEQGNIYNAYNIAQPYTAPVNTTMVGTYLNFMVCPSSPDGFRSASYTDPLSQAFYGANWAVTLAAGDYAVDDGVDSGWMDSEQCSASGGSRYAWFAARQCRAQVCFDHRWNVEHNHGFGRRGTPAIIGSTGN